MANSKLATPEELAEWLQVTTERLRQLRKSGKGPKYIKLDGRAVRYVWADVHSWCLANRQSSTGASGGK